MTHDGMDAGDAVRLSVMAMDAACQSDPAQAGQRIVDLAFTLIPCVAVDIVRRGPRDVLQITASTDRGISDHLAAAYRQWPHDRYPDMSCAATPSTAEQPTGYGQQVWTTTGLAAESTFPLRVGLAGGGFLRFLLRQPMAMNSPESRLGAAFAAHAAIVLDRAALQETVGHLLAAIVSNREIGAAVGILMARGGISYDEGFALLKSTSQNNNRKLQDVVSDVLYTGELPDNQRPRALANRRGAAALSSGAGRTDSVRIAQRLMGPDGSDLDAAGGASAAAISA